MMIVSEAKDCNQVINNMIRRGRQIMLLIKFRIYIFIKKHPSG